MQYGSDSTDDHSQLNNAASQPSHASEARPAIPQQPNTPGAPFVVPDRLPFLSEAQAYRIINGKAVPYRIVNGKVLPLDGCSNQLPDLVHSDTEAESFEVWKLSLSMYGSIFTVTIHAV